MYHGGLPFSLGRIRDPTEVRVMDRWDIVIIAAAGYVAVTTLVRLMAARRNQLVDQVRKQVAQQRSNK